MSELNLKNSRGNDDYSAMLPGWGFIRRHFFEIAALAIPLIGVVGFAAGTSFVDGWNKAAGISPNLFPAGIHETILVGLKLERPWEYSGGLIAFAIAYLYVTEMFSEWERAKWGRESHWRRWRRNKLARAARLARKVVGIQGRPTSLPNMEWKRLGPRYRWSLQHKKRSWKSKRWQKLFIRAVALVLFLSAIGISLMFVFILKVFIIEEAHSEGVKGYVQLYLAVTGRLPLNFNDKLTQSKLREFACIGRERLWEYRAVALSTAGEDVSKEHSSYIVYSTDKMFFLIDSLGSSLRSFGDAAYNMRESSNRPVSAIAKQCK